MTPGGSLRLLLTSAGIKNTSIHNALVDLLGKPIADCSAVCIPTAMYGHPNVGPGAGYGVHQRTIRRAHVRAGVEVLGVLELTAQHR
jgi:dipeptidase E